MMDEKCLNNLVFMATGLSISSRLLYGIILYRNKSTNSISFMVCGINVISSSFWIQYSLATHTFPLFIRSVCDIIISFLCFFYVGYNKYNYHFHSRNDLSSITPVKI
jgi:uncharacterized protein with PQ loop repeat